ncbi:MAG: PAS domain-containing protein [Candidatus Portnoybacteria bacterium]|nr:PAS domain-containing protein [Candidatus Portnoybacteria bacterium]
MKIIDPKLQSETISAQTKEDLQELERYIKELSIFLPLPFCVVNPLGVIINVNQAFCDLTGWEDLEIVGEEIERIFADQKEAEILKEKAQRENRVKGYETILATKNSEKISASVAISARKDKEGNSIGYFFAFFDMSELKKYQKGLQAEIKQATSQLREKLDELERFNRLAVGRELKMIELKEELERIKKEADDFKKTKPVN